MWRKAFSGPEEHTQQTCEEKTLCGREETLRSLGFGVSLGQGGLRIFERFSSPNLGLICLNLKTERLTDPQLWNKLFLIPPRTCLVSGEKFHQGLTPLFLVRNMTKNVEVCRVYYLFVTPFPVSLSVCLSVNQSGDLSNS